MGESALAISAIASVASGVASFASGMQQKAAAEAEAAQMKEQAEISRVAAIQDEAQRRKELTRTLATQSAIRAGRGVDLFSGTGKKIRQTTIHEAETDIRTAKLNFLQQQRGYLLGADAAKASGTGAMIGGVGGLLSGAGQAASTAAEIQRRSKLKDTGLVPASTGTR